MLLVHDRDGLVILNRILGRLIIEETNATVTLRLGAGENRHEIVMRTASQ